MIRDPETGRLDAIKIAKYFAVSLSELARIVGISKATLHKTPSSKKSKAALEPFEKIVRLRILLGGDDGKVLGCLNAPNEDLARVDERPPFAQWTSSVISIPKLSPEWSSALSPANLPDGAMLLPSE